MSREGGATLAEIIETIGWLAHSARLALTGLCKKTYGIEKTERGNVTCYAMAVSA